MKRLLVFAALLALFAAVTFPHERLLASVLRAGLSPRGVQVSLLSARPAFPFGYRVGGLRLAKDGYELNLQSAYLGLFGGFHTDYCGGSIEGNFTGPDDFQLRLLDGDPAKCVRLGFLSLSGDFNARIDVTDGNGSMELEANDGSVSGHLPLANADGRGISKAGMAIGEWEFDAVSAKGRLSNGKLEIESAEARAAGLQWHLTRGHISRRDDGSYQTDLYFKVRAADSSAKARVLLGLLPKATENTEGWRSYRLSGPLGRPRLLGLK